MVHCTRHQRVSLSDKRQHYCIIFSHHKVILVMLTPVHWNVCAAATVASVLRSHVRIPLFIIDQSAEM